MSLSLAGADDPVGQLHAPSPTLGVPLGDVSRIGEARRLAASVGRRAGLSAAEASDLGIVVTEIATNAVRHAGGGEVLLRLLGGPGGGGVEMLCIDRGRGMASVSESSRDGHSTGGSMGTGLGAARRIAHVFDVYSQPGSGTVVLARMWAGGAGRGPGVAVASGVCLPVDGETKCGDAWRVVSAGARSVVIVADGLGHGEGAFEASTAAMALFERHAQLRPTEILERIHAGLRSTRGAAIAITEIDAGTGRATFAGLGNIAARIITEDASRSLVSHHGIAGHEARKVQAFDYPWSAGATLIMQSDGIATQWKTESWPGILRRDPALLAGLLYRDFARPRDDSTVVVVRPSGARAPGGR